jgi:hypothetical protein
MRVSENPAVGTSPFSAMPRADIFFSHRLHGLLRITLRGLKLVSPFSSVFIREIRGQKTPATAASPSLARRILTVPPVLSCPFVCFVGHPV